MISIGENLISCASTRIRIQGIYKNTISFDLLTDTRKILNFRYSTQIFIFLVVRTTKKSADWKLYHCVIEKSGI